MSTTDDQDDAAEKGSVQINLNPALCQPRPFNKEQTLKEYGARLETVKLLAFVSTTLFSLNWFLGVCALTWASTIILGGLLPNLGRNDFYCISALLLLEALRLATATFFGNLVTRKLIYRSTLPALIKYDDKDRHHILAFARVLDQTLQLIVLSISVFLPLKRLPSLPRQPNTDFDGLHHSLRIFYTLILLNAIIAVVGVLYSKTLVVPWFTTTFSLRRYYDHIVWRGMEKGLLYITDFDFLTFAFKAFADEYRRNLRASVVYELYSDLIDYLYAHNRGFDAARLAMDSNDHCEQEAAANIVGLWAQLQGAGPSLLLQSRLLTKLADTLDHQETGRAATCSFESLARVEPEGLLEVENGRGERLMAILCKQIGKAVKVEKEDKALVFIKVLIELLNCKAGQKERQNISGNVIVEDLRKVFAGARCKKRTVGVAGKALKQMGEEPTEAEVKKWLQSPLPTEKEHILEDEKQHILELLGQDSLPVGWNASVNPRSDTWPRGSVSYANRKLFFINLSIFVLVVLAVILCSYKIHF